MVFQALTRSGGSVFRRDRLRLQRVLELVEHDLQRRDEDACALLRVASSELASFSSASASRREATAPGPLRVAGGLAQAVDRALQRLDVLLVRRRRIDRNPD